MGNTSVAEVEPIDESVLYLNHNYIHAKSAKVKKEREDEANLPEEVPESSSFDISGVPSSVDNPDGCEILDVLPTGKIRVKREIPENQERHSKCGFSDKFFC